MRITTFLPLALFAVFTFPISVLMASPLEISTSAEDSIDKVTPGGDGQFNQAPLVPGQSAPVAPQTTIPMIIEPNTPGHPHPVGDPRS